MYLKITIIAIVIMLSTSSVQSHNEVQAKPRVNYPIRISFINRMQYWYGDKIA